MLIEAPCAGQQRQQTVAAADADVCLQLAHAPAKAQFPVVMCAMQSTFLQYPNPYNMVLCMQSLEGEGEGAEGKGGQGGRGTLPMARKPKFAWHIPLFQAEPSSIVSTNITTSKESMGMQKCIKACTKNVSKCLRYAKECSCCLLRWIQGLQMLYLSHLGSQQGG